MTSLTRPELQAQIRYAQVLAQRTARLYRRAQTVGTFFAVVSGSAVLFAAPDAARLAALAVLALAGAALLAVRPADKAAANEADAKRYADLMHASHDLPLDQLPAAIAAAHRSAAQEVEPLREVAYQQVLREIGRPDYLIPLTFSQRFVGALA
jgi:hypothetical protein